MPKSAERLSLFPFRKPATGAVGSKQRPVLQGSANVRRVATVSLNTCRARGSRRQCLIQRLEKNEVALRVVLYKRKDWSCLLEKAIYRRV